MRQQLQQTARKMGQHPDVSQFARFIVVGGVNTVFGVAVYAVLVWTGVPPQPALAIAFAIGVIWNFVTHARFVFAHKGFTKFMPYITTYLCIYLVNRIALGALLSLGVHAIWAQVICAPFMAVLAFLGIGRVLTGRFPLISARD